MSTNEKKKDRGWDYRVARAKDSEGSIFLSFREVYYNSAGEICGVTQDPIDICWKDNVEDFKKIVNKAMSQPIVDMLKLKYAKFDGVDYAKDSMRRMRKGIKKATKSAVHDQGIGNGLKAKRRNTSRILH